MRRKASKPRSSRGWKWFFASTGISAAIFCGLAAAELSKDQRSQAASERQSVMGQQDDQLALSRLHLADKWGAVHATKSDHERGSMDDQEAEFLEGGFADGTGLADPAAIRPALMRDRRTRKIVVGNFLTRSFEGDQGMCFELSQKMTEDVGAPEDSMEVLVDMDFMVMLRLCAANGLCLE